MVDGHTDLQGDNRLTGHGDGFRRDDLHRVTK
jgi:hypothetical protein